jgi:hypothetical protein
VNTQTRAAHVNSTTPGLRFVVGVPLKTTVRLSQVEGDKWSGQIDIPEVRPGVNSQTACSALRNRLRGSRFVVGVTSSTATLLSTVSHLGLLPS